MPNSKLDPEPSTNKKEVFSGSAEGTISLANSKEVNGASSVHLDSGSMNRLSDAIIEMIPFGIVTFKANGEVVSANAEACKLIGQTRDQLGSENFRQLESWRNSGLLEAAEKALSTKYPVHLDVQLPNKTGGLIWVAFRLNPHEHLGEEYLTVVFSDTSDRHMVDEELRRSDELVKVAGELSKIGFWEFDVKTQKLTWTDQLYRIRELQNVFEPTLAFAVSFFSPEARPILDAAREALINRGQPWDMELPMTTATGRNLWVRTQGAAKWQHGEVVRIYGALQDVTEQHLAGELSRVQSAALNAAANAIVITDLNGIIEWVNPAFTQLTGYSASEVIGQNPRVLKSGHQDHCLYTDLWNQILSGNVWRGEVINRRKDGSEYFERMTITPIRSTSGEVFRFVAVKEDISENRRIESKLRESEEKYRLLVENGDDLIYGGTCVGGDWNTQTVTYLSPNFEQILGLDPHNFILSPERWRNRIHPADLEEANRKAIEGFLGHQSVTRVYRCRTNILGTYRWLEDKVFPNFNSDGLVIGFTGIARDITDRKAVEEELRSLNECLERRVQDRTAELEVAKLQAEEANRAKSEFLSRMSHELRTPLNAVLGYAQLLEVMYEDSRIREFSESIQKGGQHLLKLINEVLDISRIEAGRMALSLEPLSVRHVLAQAHDLVKPIAFEAKVDLHIDHGLADERLVLADRQRLLQIFINLLDNAIKYNRRNGRVEVRCFASSENCIKIEFTDTGIGISTQDSIRLFHPFSRLEKKEAEGTGLGLALSRQLAQMMGGSLELVESNSEGTKFAVELRYADKETLPNVDPETPPPVAFQAGEHSKILYIEDNPSNLRLLEIVAQTWKHVEIFSATDGNEGIILADRLQPDLILLDLHLPDMDGKEVLVRLKSESSTNNIPIVILTADAISDRRESLLDEGAMAFLTKPYDIKALTETVLSVLNSPSILPL